MKDTLNARFRAPLREHYRRRIIVWRDEAGEFAETVAEMTLDNARILTMKPGEMFELRRKIEVEYANENLLLYCPMAFEKPQDNWLLDVFLYSEEFRADFWSLLFAELNIENARPVREYAKTVAPFFASRERRAKLHALRGAYRNERELQTGVFGVLCGAKAYGFAEVVRMVLSVPPEEENIPLQAMAKCCGENAFWRACEGAYGYVGDPDTEQLACHMLVTAAMNASQELHFPGLPYNAAYTAQAYGFFVEWKRADAEGIARLCQQVEERYRVPTLLKRMKREELMQIGVFPAAEQQLLEAEMLRFADGCFDLDEAQALLKARHDQPWAEEYAPYTGAVRALIDMQRFHLAYWQGFHYTALKEMWTAYTDELYRMDQYYRAFCVAYDQSLALGVMALEDSLKAAADAAERLYKNWFLTELNAVWTQLLSHQPMEELTGVPRQQAFYRRNIAGAENRIYVVISDGFRYEAAQTLCERLNGKLNGNTHLDSMAGLVPGTTPVGMAALLPHRRMRMNDELKLLCDDMSTEAPNREKVLRAACTESIALDYADFRRFNKAQRGEAIKGKKVVYLYHDTVDRTGESGGNVPMACEAAVEELTQLVRILVNECSASQVLVTADHGFLYTRSPLGEYEKTGKEIISGEILEYKRRYAIVKGGAVDERSVTIPLDEMERPELNAVFPRECLRFRMQGGGAGYIHGGLSLQEMVIPLLRYQNKKAGQKGYTAITKTSVTLLGENRKISNNLFTLHFYQEQPCADKVQPRVVLAYFEDRQGQRISDEHRLICDMTAADNQQRTLRVTFHLLGGHFDPSETYELVLRDEDEKADLARIPFQISIVFENDFGF